ncbi:ROK family transcriptional regulator [Actinoallomurus rhizosphaericola]|uniref:ROK family transcriptional regulator n=1 Tax=Actinoallomurus rhizosphaericola TaxID=2952536 RepID=UPI0020933405|nr:ROK family transcriptional regulator [Actinoallomurus rhizosphaericola]MCO5995426.1 ROK family transcriptional regulator [Actinoallomurus rhizosphaericola]
MPNVSAPSAGHLLQFIRAGAARTRRDLMELTGLSRSTVAQRVDQLVSAGYVREGGVDASTGGRRPSLLEIDEGSAVVLAADIGATHGRVAVTDLAGRALGETTGRPLSAEGPEKAIAWMTSRFRDLLADCGRSVAEVCGVGVGLPAPVDVRTGRTVQTPIAPGWERYDLPAALAAEFPGPIMLDNDANVMALGEYTAAGPDTPPVLLVKVATGIGAGIVEDGRVLRGVGGAAGEIGHVRVSGREDVVCSCGSRGCLAAVASGAALARELAAGDPSVRDASDVARLALAGHPEAVRLTREAGRTLGEVLAVVVSVVNPGSLIIAGSLAGAGEHLVGEIREVVFRGVQYRSTRGLQIGEGRLGGRAGVVGAASMVIDRVFSPEAVDARIAAAESLRAGC